MIVFHVIFRFATIYCESIWMGWYCTRIQYQCDGYMYHEQNLYMFTVYAFSSTLVLKSSVSEALNPHPWPTVTPFTWLFVMVCTLMFVIWLAKPVKSPMHWNKADCCGLWWFFHCSPMILRSFTLWSQETRELFQVASHYILDKYYEKGMWSCIFWHWL